MTHDYTIIRSDRRTLALEITDNSELIVRAPRRCPNSYIESFVDKHSHWIGTHMEKQRIRAESRICLTGEEQEALVLLAKEKIPPIVEHYADIMGLSPQGVRITKAEKRFGSCSGKNRLCFSYRLMQYPQEAIEYVVVHELAHIVHKNHGRDFYALIETTLPDYKKREALLKK